MLNPTRSVVGLRIPDAFESLSGIEVRDAARTDRRLLRDDQGSPPLSAGAKDRKNVAAVPREYPSRARRLDLLGPGVAHGTCSGFIARGRRLLRAGGRLFS
jgi:hypothetical protein